MKKRTPGFSLIEVLVVIAIIGILTTMGFTATLGLKNEANNSRVKAELSQVRVQAIAIKNETNHFFNLCDGDNTLNDAYQDLKVLEEDIVKRSGQPVVCHAAENAYCVRARMRPSGGYCIDLTGYAGTSSPNCNPTTFRCEI